MKLRRSRSVNAQLECVCTAAGRKRNPFQRCGDTMSPDGRHCKICTLRRRWRVNEGPFSPCRPDDWAPGWSCVSLPTPPGCGGAPAAHSAPTLLSWQPSRSETNTPTQQADLPPPLVMTNTIQPGCHSSWSVWPSTLPTLCWGPMEHFLEPGGPKAQLQTQSASWKGTRVSDPDRVNRALIFESSWHLEQTVKKKSVVFTLWCKSELGSLVLLSKYSRLLLYTLKTGSRVCHSGFFCSVFQNVSALWFIMWT